MSNRLANSTCAGLAIVTTIAWAGCGGSSSSPRLTKSEFISRANAVCAVANSGVEKLQFPADLPSTGTFAAGVLPLAEEAKKKLSALEPPGEQKAEYRKMMGLLDDEITKYSDLRHAAEAGDDQRAQTAVDDIDALSEQFNSDATDLGLGECARDAEPQG